MRPGTIGHGRSTRVEMSCPPTTTLARDQAAGTPPGQRRRAAFQHLPIASTARRAGPGAGTSSPNGGVPPHCTHRGVETHGELHGPLSEALAPRAHGPPGHARIESSGSLKDLDPQPGQDRRADRGSAVTPAPQDEVRQQGVADLAGRTPNAPHEDPMDPAGLAYQARVAAVEGHR